MNEQVTQNTRYWTRVVLLYPPTTTEYADGMIADGCYPPESFQQFALSMMGHDDAMIIPL